MAVYGWIYANAKRKGDSGDYQVRFCDPQFTKYRTRMISLSRCMLSTSKRYGEAEAQICWFSGFLDKKIRFFVVAAAGRQEELLAMSLDGGGFRRQYGVFALGFDGDDIGLVRRDLRVFKPLEKILSQIQQTDGKGTAEGPLERQDYGAYRETVSDAARHDARGNIVPSSPDVDATLWQMSLQRPVMTGILSEADAKKLLGVFPDGIVTVTGELRPQQFPASGLSEDDRKKLRASGILVRAEKTAAVKDTAAEVYRKERSGPAGESAASQALGADGERSSGRPSRTAADLVVDLRKSRYGKVKRREIRVCAEHCKSELWPEEVAAAHKAVQKMKRTGEVAEQLFYFCCMRLWIFRQEDRKLPAGKELPLLLQSMEEQVAEKKLLQTNCMLRRAVLRLRGEDDAE